MKRKRPSATILRLAACGALLAALTPGAATAGDPCGDFDECKVLIEINATDGDIGFFFLMDAEDLLLGRLKDPNDTLVFWDRAAGPLKEQFMTETFLESAEPLCWDDPEAEEDEEIVTLEEFLERWADGTYTFTGRSGEDLEVIEGETELTYELPAAPRNLDFDGGVISWSPGQDLGNCGSASELEDLVEEGILPVHPEDVVVDTWEVVLEPEGEEHLFVVRLPGGVAPLQVTVPADYLAALPDDTPVKIEVGAIGGGSNATFSEVGGFCVNEVEGCEEE
jgi:hypothetical protein